MILPVPFFINGKGPTDSATATAAVYRNNTTKSIFPRIDEFWSFLFLYLSYLFVFHFRTLILTRKLFFIRKKFIN